MIAEKEKAQLIVEVLEKFAPYMDNATDQFQQMGGVITNFGTLIESLAELPDEKKMPLMTFIRLFNIYIEKATANHNELRGFYSFMTSTTNTIIAEYKAAIGVE